MRHRVIHAHATILRDVLPVALEPSPHDALHGTRGRLAPAVCLLVHAPAAPVEPAHVLVALVGAVRVLVETRLQGACYWYAVHKMSEE